MATELILDKKSSLEALARTPFNKDFLWGTASSAFQMEGSQHADWATWDGTLLEHTNVTGHYERCREDLALIKDMGLNAYRFSPEWARVLDMDVTPMLTLHHFTHPRWFHNRCPWHEEGSVEAFLQYAKRMVDTVEGVRHWITFNEPNVLLFGGYMDGAMPPGIKDMFLARRALMNILKAHCELYDYIHKRHPGSKVSMALNMTAFAPYGDSPMDSMLAAAADKVFNKSFLELFDQRAQGSLLLGPLGGPSPARGKLDFIGINYYMRAHLRFNLMKADKLGTEMHFKDMDNHGLTDMGWETHPQGFGRFIRMASELGVPVMITENGISTSDEGMKASYIDMHLLELADAVNSGIQVDGYFYWSLMDNYEWLMGLTQRFGLYGVNYRSLQRTPTAAARFYAQAVREAKCPADLTEI